jgi:exonuclease SbcC
LWAFFGSRGGGPRFQNELIPWSGGSVKDPTVVEVTLAIGGDSYTVRRGLKNNSTTAEAQDSSGKAIVTGTTDVTRWVEEHLLRMDRTAFEATFYAKQKELRFFAHDDGIGRVRKISKMLGISRVEDAQKLLREDRNDLRTEARLIESRLAEADEDSLKHQLEEFKSSLSAWRRSWSASPGEYEAAQTELEAARKARSVLDAAHREHTKLANALQEAEAERRRAGDRIEEAERDLDEISAAEEELRKLKPQVAQLPELEEQLERLEEDRRCVEQRGRDRKELRAAQKRVADIEAEAFDTLEELDGAGSPLPGWDDLFDLDGAELLSETVAVLEKAEEKLNGPRSVCVSSRRSRLLTPSTDAARTRCGRPASGARRRSASASVSRRSWRYSRPARTWRRGSASCARRRRNCASSLRLGGVRPPPTSARRRT